MARPSSFYLQVFGCQLNWHDADHIAAYLENLGWSRETEKNASLVVVVGCSVRQHAVDRIHGMIDKWTKNNPDVKIILCGCVLLEDRQKFSGKVTSVCSTEEIEEVLWGIIRNSMSSRLSLKGAWRDLRDSSTSVPLRQGFAGPSAGMTAHSTLLYYIPIMWGCNRFCSYCATAIAKARERSRALAEILAELDEAEKLGAKEVMFLGQTVTSYGRDIKNHTNFAELINQALKKPHHFLVTFLSPYPTDFTDELIEVLALSPRIKHEFHLPLQSGSNLVLQSMKRQYSVEKYGVIINKIRAKMPDAKISTDIIVGFPGETETEFQESVASCKKFNFAKAFIGKYSPRPGTYSALHLIDDVLREEKERRFRVIDGLVNKKKLCHLDRKLQSS